MSANLDWRRIEFALEYWFRKEGMTIDTNAGRDKIVTVWPTKINLTLLAQDLAKELEK